MLLIVYVSLTSYPYSIHLLYYAPKLLYFFTGILKFLICPKLTHGESSILAVIISEKLLITLRYLHFISIIVFLWEELLEPEGSKKGENLLRVPKNDEI
jgi:hypothetical protein